MKLPEIRMGGVQSLGQENIAAVGAVARAKMAETRAMTGAIAGTMDMLVDKIDKYEVGKADTHLIESMADIEEKYAGVDAVPADDPDIQKYAFNRNDVSGNPRTEIPVHEFFGQMYEDTAKRAMSEASEGISLPASRRDWSTSIGKQYTQNISRLKIRMAEQQQQYMQREQELMIDAALMNDRIGVAQQLLKSFIGTPGERAILEARIGRAGRAAIGRRARAGSDEAFAEYDDVVRAEGNQEEINWNDDEREARATDKVSQWVEEGGIENAEANAEAMNPSNVEMLSGETYTATDPLTASALKMTARTPEDAEEQMAKFNETVEKYGGGEEGRMVAIAEMHSGTGLKEIDKAMLSAGTQEAIVRDDEGNITGGWIRRVPKDTRRHMQKVFERRKMSSEQWELNQKAVKRRITWHKKKEKMQKAEPYSKTMRDSAKFYMEFNEKAFGSAEEKEEFNSTDVAKLQDRMSPEHLRQTKIRQARLSQNMSSVDVEGEAIKAATNGVSEGKAQEIKVEASYAVNNAAALSDKPLSLTETKAVVNEATMNVYRRKPVVPAKDKKQIISAYKAKNNGVRPTMSEIEAIYSRAHR